MAKRIRPKKCFIFKVSLKDGPARRQPPNFSLPVVRRIAISGNQSLYTFAKSIVESIDFYFDHCFGFYSNINNSHDSFDSYELFVDIGEEGSNFNTKGVKKIKVKDVFGEYDKMLFLFDYGDGWQFIIEKEGVEDMKEGEKYPQVIEKTGLSPLQYPPLDEDWQEI